MNTVQNGKGDRPRNNWGPQWYSGYASIAWRHDKLRQAPIFSNDGPRPARDSPIHPAVLTPARPAAPEPASELVPQPSATRWDLDILEDNRHWRGGINE
jgi:hypothetical protein